jgi:hypothetical protein
VQATLGDEQVTDFGPYSQLVLEAVRAHGDNFVYKVILKDSTNTNSSIDFEQYFYMKAQTAVQQVRLDLTDFVCSYHGQPCPDTTLDLQHVSTVGLQIAGGVYSKYSQTGVGSLELTSIGLL